MIEEIRRAELAIGVVNYSLTPEAHKNRNGRRSLYVSAKIEKGQPFSEANIKSVRPGFGLDTQYKSIVLGRKALQELNIGDRLSWDVIQ